MSDSQGHTTSVQTRPWQYFTAPQWVDVDGHPTAYRSEGDGETVVFLHGESFNRMWLPVFGELADAARLVAPEQPGFGDTEAGEWIAGFDDVVLHYDALLRNLGLERVHLVGHSLGGWLAANLAIFYPNRFQSLTLLTPMGVRLPDDVAVPDMFRLAPEERLERVFNGRAAGFSEYFEQEGQLEDTLREYSDSLAVARLAWNPRYDHRLDRRLARVKIPTLVIGAKDDRLVPNETADRYASLIPNAELVRVEGRHDAPAGHALHIEYPGETAAAILEHVRANA